MTTTVPTVRLGTGIDMPVLGFGVFQIPTEDTEQIVADALAAGYRSLDTAASYRNEEAVGRASRFAPTGSARTSTSSTSSSATRRRPASPPSTPARRSSSITATPSW
jgi:2,5-diketo-D-gluconate reductase A